MREKIKVGLMSTQGLPPRYGAFEQTIDKICSKSSIGRRNIMFIVPTRHELAGEDCAYPNVKRVLLRRRSGLGILLYNLLSIFFALANGCRVLVFFGYGAAIFFPFLRLLGVKIICNVDGFEWRRPKWGAMTKLFLKLSQHISVYFSNNLIFDSYCIERYYSKIYKVSGNRIFYGSDDVVFREPTGSEHIPSQDFYCTVMRLEPENNIEVMVKAFRKTSASQQFVIIGPPTPWFEKNIRPLIDEDNRIIHLGPIYEKSLLNWYRSHCRAYLHGHSVGGTNPTLVEAVKIGRPIIAYKSVYNREVLSANASYFRSADDLEILFGVEGPLRRPPRLSDEYEWDYVANCYLDVISAHAS